jgi:hypothetical protein
MSSTTISTATLLKRHFAYPSPQTFGLFAVWDSREQRYRENQIGDVTNCKFILEEYGSHRIAELMAEWYDENPEYRNVAKTTATKRA